jgi:subtilase family serine protease
VLDAGDTVLGGRGILGLTAGASSSGGLNAHISPTQPLGQYFVITCADGSNNVNEIDETNNCVASSTEMTIALPDYRVTAISEPPTSGQRGMALSVSDTTRNVGPVEASATSDTNYYLSKNPKLDATDPLLGGRGVVALPTHASSSGGLNAHVPSDLAAGQYFVLACADADSDVAESNESNNCAHSSGKITVTVPDYRVTSVTDPPATATRHSEFSISDVVHNSGSAAIASSINSYWLSHDNVIGPTDYRLSTTVDVSALPGGATAFDDDVVLTVPFAARHIKLGHYHVIVCADSTNVLAESHETNNCHASTGTVQIVASTGPAALVGHHGVR